MQIFDSIFLEVIINCVIFLGFPPAEQGLKQFFAFAWILLAVFLVIPFGMQLH